MYNVRGLSRVVPNMMINDNERNVLQKLKHENSISASLSFFYPREVRGANSAR